MQQEYKPLKLIVIGLGHQSIDDHLPAIKESNQLELIGVHDIDEEKTNKVAYEYGVTPIISSHEFIKYRKKDIEAALVAVPHHNYIDITTLLAENGINIIKEKPFATSISNAKQMVSIIRKNNIALTMTLQRRFNPVFTTFAQLIKRIGKIHAIEAKYVMNIDRLDEGWRASRLFSGGGALVDLGYHYVDLIVWYFGLPDSVTCQLSSGNREGQKYDVEDTAFVQFSYNSEENDAEHILGNLVVSRTYPEKEEGLTAFGTRGHVSVQRGCVRRVFNHGKELNEERLERFGSWPSALVDQLEACSKFIRDKRNLGKITSDYLKHIALIEACYQSAALRTSINPHQTYQNLISELSLSNGDLL